MRSKKIIICTYLMRSGCFNNMIVISDFISHNIILETHWNKLNGNVLIYGI